MRILTFGLLVVLCSGLLLGGCAKKEMVKTEESVISSAQVVPEAPLPVPEPQQPAPVTSEIVQEQVIVPAEPQKSMPAELPQKEALDPIFFDFDKSDLREPDREILARNGRLLLDKMTGNVQIEGHCDERGSAEYNLALGERRAMSAMKYLVTLGVPANRLSVISYGKEKPFDPGHDEEAWAKNRRDQFVKIGE